MITIVLSMKFPVKQMTLRSVFVSVRAGEFLKEMSVTNIKEGEQWIKKESVKLRSNLIL